VRGSADGCEDMEYNFFSKSYKIISYIVLFILTAFLVSIPILALTYKLHLIYLIIASVPGAVGIGSVVSEIYQQRFSTKVRIDSRGIDYVAKNKTISILWSRIQLIGMAKTPAKFKARVIIFSTRNDIEELSKMCDLKNISENFMFCFYNKELFAQIKKYWKEEIIDEDRI